MGASAFMIPASMTPCLGTVRLLGQLLQMSLALGDLADLLIAILLFVVDGYSLPYIVMGNFYCLYVTPSYP